MAKTEDLLKRIQELEQENSRLKQEQDIDARNALFNNKVPESKISFWFEISLDDQRRVVYAKLYDWTKVSYIDEFVGYEFDSLLDDASTLNFENTLKKVKNKTEVFLINLVKSKWAGKYLANIELANENNCAFVLKLFATNSITNTFKEHFKLISMVHKAQELSKLGFWRYEYNTDTLYLSEIILKQLGLNKSNQVIKHASSLSSVIHPEDVEQLKIRFNQLSESANTLVKLIRVLQNDGSLKFVELRANKIFDKDNDYMNGSVIDITEQYIEHDKLKKNEQLLKNIASQSTDVFIVFKLKEDLNNNIVDYQYNQANAVFGLQFGIDPASVKNQFLSEMQPDIYKQLAPILSLTYTSSEAFHDRFYFENLDLHFDILIYSPQEHYLVTIWRDVSLQVNTEINLRQNIENYQGWFEAMPDSLLMVDSESNKILEVNQTAIQKLGKTRNELLGDLIYSYVDQSALQEEKLKKSSEITFAALCLKSNGEWGQSEVSLVKSVWKGKHVDIVSIRNIEEQIAEKEKMILKDRFFTKTFENIVNPLLVLENKKVKLINNAALKLFNTSASEIQNRNFYELCDENNLNSKAKDDLDRLLTEKINHKAELEWTTIDANSNKHVYIFHVTDIDVSFNQKLIAIADNTLISNYIEKIEKENKYKKNLVDRSNMAIWEWHIDTNEIKFVNGWEKLIGYSSDEFPGNLEELESLMHPSEVNLTYNYLSEFLTGKIAHFDLAFRIKCKNGIYKWINTNGFVENNEQDSPVKFIGVSFDFTKNKLREENLKKHNLEISQTLEAANIGYWEIDLITMMFTGSPEVIDILGLPSNKQITLKQVEDIIYSADQEYFMSQFSSKSSNSTQPTTFRIVKADSSIRYISSIIRSVENKGGSLSKYYGIFQDVTQVAENVLQNKSIESTTEITSIDLPLAIITNEKFLMITNRFSKLIGYSEQELNDGFINIQQILTQEFRESFREYLERISTFRQQESSISVNLKTKYGRVRTVSVQGTKFYWKSKEAFLLFFKDETKETFETEIIKKELKIYKHLNDNATYGAMLLTNDGVVVYKNQKVNELLGYVKDELEGRDFLSLLAEHDKDIFQDTVNKIVLQKSFDQLEITLLTKQGKDITLKIDVCYADIEEGNVCVFLQDIDKYKKLYQNEKEQKDIMVSIAEVSTNGIGLLDEDMNLVVSNEAFASFVDSDIDRLHKFVNRLSKKYSEVAYLINKFKNREEARIQITHNEGANSSLVIRMRVMNISNKYYLLIFAVDQSIVESKLVHLTNEKNKFKLIFDNSPFGYALVNKDRVIINCNTGLTKILGITTKNLENKKIDQFFDNTNLNELHANFSQLFTGLKSDVVQEATLRDINRQSRQVAVTMQAVIQSNEDADVVLITIIDITKRLSHDKFIVNQERINTINQIGNIIAHRFNNYLMSIYGNAYSLLQNVEREDDKVRAEKIIGSVGKVSGLTRNLLGFSENYRSIKIEFELNELLTNIIDSLRNEKNTNIQFDVDFESPVRRIQGDPDMIYTAISNILQNSLDALENKGTIQLNTDIVFLDQDQKLNYGEAIKEGEYLRIRISDTAGSIDVADFEQLFDPFFTTKDVILNAGLGLTTAKNIIRRHNGGIKLVVTPGDETTFYVYLPLIKNLSTSELGNPRETLINKGNVNILLVDDEELVRNVTSELLAKLGYNVYSFDSGKESVKFYKENNERIQLVILDMYMPEMPGLEVLEQLKNTDQNVKVILLSGFSPDEAMAEQLKDQNCSFIQKPVNIEKLSYAISSSLK